MTEIDFIKAKLDFYKLTISMCAAGLFLIFVSIFTIDIDKPDVYIVGFAGILLVLCIIIHVIAYNIDMKLLR